MASLLNLVRVGVTTSGVGGTLALGPEVAGRLNFSSGGGVTGTEYSYTLQDGESSEVATGVWDSTANTITRTTRISTNGLGIPIDLSGRAELCVVPAAEDLENAISIETLASFGRIFLGSETAANAKVLLGYELLPYLGAVTSGTCMPTGNSAANNQCLSRIPVRARGNITSLQLLYPNFYLDAAFAEVGSGSAATVACNIEYPKGEYHAVTVPSTIPDGQMLLMDNRRVLIPDGAVFWINTFFEADSSLFYSYAVGSRILLENSGLSAGMITTPWLGEPSSTTIGYGPIAILGTTTRPSVLTLEDSRGAGGSGDVSDQTLKFGQLHRALDPYFGSIRCARSGDRAVAFVASHTNRVQLGDYVSHVVNGLGINDVRNAQSADQLQADFETIAGYFPGKVLLAATIPPESSSGDSWASNTQTADPGNADRIIFNNRVRANSITGYTDHFEVADPLEDGRDSGIWPSNGIASYFTEDGLHPTRRGTLRVADSGGIDPRKIDPIIQRLATPGQIGSVADNVAVTPADVGNMIRGLPGNGMGNLFVNPFMEISQRYDGAVQTVGAGLRVLDRWLTGEAAATLVLTAQRANNPFTSIAGYRVFAHALHVIATTAQASLAAGEIVQPCSQAVEGTFLRWMGWGTVNARPVTFVLPVMASVSGIYSVSIRNSAADLSYVATFPLTANTPTTIIFKVPGPTTGTWLTTTGIGARIDIMSTTGSTYEISTPNVWSAGNYLSHASCVDWQGTLNASVTIGAAFALPEGVMNLPEMDLLMDTDVINQLVNMRRPFELEMAMAQRYCQVRKTIGSESVIASGYMATTTSCRALFPSNVLMRAQPTIEFYTGVVGDLRVKAGADLTPSAIGVSGGGFSEYGISVAITTGVGTANNAAAVTNPTTKFGFTAEIG